MNLNQILFSLWKQLLVELLLYVRCFNLVITFDGLQSQLNTITLNSIDLTENTNANVITSEWWVNIPNTGDGLY